GCPAAGGRGGCPASPCFLGPPCIVGCRAPRPGTAGPDSQQPGPVQLGEPGEIIVGETGVAAVPAVVQVQQDQFLDEGQPLCRRDLAQKRAEIGRLSSITRARGSAPPGLLEVPAGLVQAELGRQGQVVVGQRGLLAHASTSFPQKSRISPVLRLTERVEQSSFWANSSTLWPSIFQTARDRSSGVGRQSSRWRYASAISAATSGL